MLAERILVPTDFSRSSKSALQFAVAMANGREASILLVHVVEPSVPTYDEVAGVLEPEALWTNVEMLDSVRNRDVDIDAVILHGSPAEEILRCAREHQIDLIVMGTRGRSDIASRLIGGTATAVLRAATCPVMTVRDVSGDETDTLTSDSINTKGLAE